MIHVEHVQFLQSLRDSRESVIERWFRAIAFIGFSGVNSTLLRQRLSSFTDTVIALLSQETVDRFRAHGIGVALARLHYTPSTEVLSRSQEVLLRSFTAELPIEHAMQIQPQLATLMGALAAGFCDQARDILLAEQEQIRQAMLVERNQAIEALRASEARLRMVATNIPVIMFALDRSGVFTLSEGRGLDAAGLRPSDLIGRSIFAVYQDTPDMLDWASRARNGEILRSTSTMGGLSYEHWVTPLRDTHGELIGVSGVAIDVTERARADGMAARTQTLLTTVIDNLPAMVFLKDAADLRFVLVNKAGEELIGCPAAELIGKNDYDIFPRAEADFFRAKDREVLERKCPLEIIEEPIQTRNRGLRLLHTRKIPILDTEGQPKYLLGISEDITDHICK